VLATLALEVRIPPSITCHVHSLHAASMLCWADGSSAGGTVYAALHCTRTVLCHAALCCTCAALCYVTLCCGVLL
jgi:hypothetical protein